MARYVRLSITIHDIGDQMSKVHIIAAMAMATISTLTVSTVPVQAQVPMAASSAFRDSAKKVEQALTKGDIGTANAYVAALSPQTPLEHYMAGSLKLDLAARRNDAVSARAAVKQMLDSGAVPPEQMGYTRYLAGYFAYQTGATDDAIAQLSTARQLGFNDSQVSLLLAENLSRKGRSADALNLVSEAIAQQDKSRQAVPAAWLERGAAFAYASRNPGAGAVFSSRRLSLGASGPEWRSAIAGYAAAAALDTEQRLDMWRLQAATGALAGERDFEGYATAAGATRPAEARAIIDRGIREGDLLPSNPVTAPLAAKLSAAATKEKADIAKLLGKSAAAASAAAASAAGDKLLSAGDDAEAAAYYRVALAKNTTAKDRVLTRLGIALARSGNIAQARDVLARAQGKWGEVGRFWSALPSR